MTEPIKINCEEVLEACLKKTKITTIHKAYTEKWGDGNGNEDSVYFEDKPAKWKVGDVCDVQWTGKLKDLAVHRDFYDMGRLGKVEIISVEKIKFWKSEGEWYHTPLKQYPHSSLLAEDEGFDSPEDMFKCIESYSGGLDTPKPFWLVSFKWL